MNKNYSKEILQKVVDDYDQIASEFDLSRHQHWKEFESFLAHIKKGDKILDLGCGNGRLYQYLAKQKKVDYIGVDNSKNLLSAAKKNNPKATFKEGNLLEIPLKNHSIDVITCIAAFHHIPTNKLRQKALTEMQRVLKPNGKLILSVWNLFQPKYKKYIWKSRIKSLLTLGKHEARGTLIPWAHSGIERYYYAFKAKELRNLLEKANFRVLTEEHHNNLVFICQKSSK